MDREWALQGLLAGRGWDLEESSLSERGVGKAALGRASANTPRLGGLALSEEALGNDPRPRGSCWRLGAHTLVLSVTPASGGFFLFVWGLGGISEVVMVISSRWAPSGLGWQGAGRHGGGAGAEGSPKR